MIEPRLGSVSYVVVLTMVLASLSLSAPAMAHNSEQKARLTARAIVGGSGDRDGGGRAEIKSSAEIDTLCYKLYFNGLKPVRSAHIHQAVSGQNGDITLTLFDNKRRERRAEGCIHDVDASLLESMQASPQGYYVDLHNRQHPKGALRGQLQNLNESDYFETSDPYRPEPEDARRAGTIIVNNGHTPDHQLSVTINAPMGTPSQPAEVVVNLQMTLQGGSAGLFVRYEFPAAEDYDIIVQNAQGDDVARADGANPSAVGPLAEPNGNGGHSEVGAEQIDGLRTDHCDGYTLRLVTTSGVGGKLPLKLWMGEALYP